MIEFIRELNRNYLSIVHEDEREPDYTMTVSYTHLTLPTKA